MNLFKDGVYQITNEEYHASEGLSRSALWLYRQNPYKYWYQYLSGKYAPPPAKDSFVLGDLVHSMVLEPGLFAEKYVIEPKFDRRTTAGKNAHAIFHESMKGKACVTEEQHQTAKAIKDSIHSRDMCLDLLNKTRIEQSIYWVDGETGIQCKVRPDAWSRLYVVDLKTTQDASYRSFQNSAAKYGYFLQAGMIWEAMKSIGEPIQRFVNIAVETHAPHALATYIMDEEAVEYGIDLFHALLRKFAVSMETKEFNDYGLQILMAPKYAIGELEE